MQELFFCLQGSTVMPVKSAEYYVAYHHALKIEQQDFYKDKVITDVQAYRNKWTKVDK
jgi:hypothetical protein